MKEWGEIVVLPKGWSTRQSKTHDGKTYYVSPYGHTRWLRPPLRSGKALFNLVQIFPYFAAYEAYHVVNLRRGVQLGA